jgi:dihydrofolate reductase
LPLFVVTHSPPDRVPDGPLSYTFVTDGIESAVEQAREAAVGRDVVLMGASMVQQCLRAGLLDEIIINLVPVLLGDGVRLFEAGDSGDYELVIDSDIAAPGVTHLTYRVVR